MSRYMAREAAFMVVFEHSFHKEKEMQTLINFFYQNEEFKSLGEETGYFETLVKGVEEKEKELDEIIEHFAIEWKVNRISRTTVAMLRVALYEILYMDDIGHKVSVNEAVEILKKYDMEEAAKFANGVLGGFLKSKGIE